jgi:hypothetical protein
MEYAPTAPKQGCMRCAVRRLGLRKTAVGLRPVVRFFSGTFFCDMEMLRISFIGRKKTSHTAGTLCEIKTRTFLKMEDGGIRAAVKITNFSRKHLTNSFVIYILVNRLIKYVIIYKIK